MVDIIQLMGSGTASGIQTPPQKGVIMREGENFPHIPENLLKLSPEQLQSQIEGVSHAIVRDLDSPFYSLESTELLENKLVLLAFAKTVVERQQKSPHGQERAK